MPGDARRAALLPRDDRRKQIGRAVRRAGRRQILDVRGQGGLGLRGAHHGPAVKAALALTCTVQERSIFARKNYFYPDLPKGYQISQYEQPLATEGALEYSSAGKTRRVGIIRVHMEEDAGKSLHEGFPDSHRHTYVDFNRSGTP